MQPAILCLHTVVEVGFTDLDLKVSEGDRFVVLRVLKEGDNERTVTVNAFAVDGTAVGQWLAADNYLNLTLYQPVMHMVFP